MSLGERNQEKGMYKDRNKKQEKCKKDITYQRFVFFENPEKINKAQENLTEKKGKKAKANIKLKKFNVTRDMRLSKYYKML